MSALERFNDVLDSTPRFDQMADELASEAVKKQYAFLDPRLGIPWLPYKRAMHSFFLAQRADAIETFSRRWHQNFSKAYGIVCFSQHIDSILMWGHYAGSHQGFAVEFEYPHPFFPETEFGEVRSRQ